MCQEQLLEKECRCRAAVAQAYDGMRRSGATEMVALDVASRVYRHYHPEACPAHSRMEVELWLLRKTLH
jgi:hypothetical protein